LDFKHGKTKQTRVIW